MRMGQEFAAWAHALERGMERIQRARMEMYVINMGATAIGTSINANAGYLANVTHILAEATHEPFRRAEDLIDATQNPDGFVDVSGAIKNFALVLSKIANDLRLLSSGPRGGLEEIHLPARQHGSSIMPGKINPVIPEVINQIAFNVIGNDTTVTMAVEAGQLELNAFEPIIFKCLFESLEMLTNGVNVFVEDCIKGITVNVDKCTDEVERSIGIVTALCPRIGYTKASNLAKKALKENKRLKEVIIEEKILSEQEIEKILDPSKMI
jgi:aspartate ammonia-lyase